MTSKPGLWLLNQATRKTSHESVSSFAIEANEPSLKKLEEGKSHDTKGPKKDKILFLSVGVSAFLGETSGPHPRGKGKEVAGGMAVNLSNSQVKLFKSVAVTGAKDVVAGFNYSVGLTVGAFHGSIQDFFGSSTERTATVIQSFGTIETEAGSEGVFSSFGVGAGLGTATLESYTEEIQ